MRTVWSLLSACLILAGAAVCADEASAKKDAAAPSKAEPATTAEKPAGEKAAEKPHAAAADAHGGDAHGGHGHDESDLSHANGTPQLHKPDELRFDLAIASFIIFVLLLAILTKFAWGPIVAGLDAREQGIADRIEAAKLAAEKAEAQLRSYEAKLAAASEESRQIVAQARRDAEAAKEKIAAEAQALAQREREKAVEDITAAKNAALREIAEKSVGTAISLARDIVRREVKPEDHDRLITDALGQFSKLN